MKKTKKRLNNTRLFTHIPIKQTYQIYTSPPSEKKKNSLHEHLYITWR